MRTCVRKRTSMRIAYTGCASRRSGADRPRRCARVARRRRRHLRRGRGHPVAQGEGRPRWPGCCAPPRPDEVEPATGVAGRRAAAGPDRRRLAHPGRARRRAGRRRRRCRSRAVDATLDELAATTGAGSTARRAALLGELFGAATADEQAFLRRLLTGELRQGALEGVMLEAIAAAAEVPAAAVRRAFMLSGRLPRTARLALTGGDGGPGRGARCRSGGRSGRCSPRPPTPWTARWPSSAPRSASSTSWTARGSRCTATATRCGSGPAPCARSPRACPSWSSWCARCPAGRWCSTARRWRCATTAGRARSRRR